MIRMRRCRMIEQLKSELEQAATDYQRSSDMTNFKIAMSRALPECLRSLNGMLEYHESQKFFLLTANIKDIVIAVSLLEKLNPIPLVTGYKKDGAQSVCPEMNAKELRLANISFISPYCLHSWDNQDAFTFFLSVGSEYVQVRLNLRVPLIKTNYAFDYDKNGDIVVLQDEVQDGAWHALFNNYFEASHGDKTKSSSRLFFQLS